MESDNDECGSVGNSKEGNSNSQVLRPRRNVGQKNAEYNNGLHWIEEKDLKKALYASLQDSKKLKLSDIDGDTNDSVVLSSFGLGRKRKTEMANNNGESADGGRRSKVHAQRKFAQGSNPNSPTVTPIKLKSSVTSSVDFPPMKRPKTEDFLTFLCLRGTPVLPSTLAYFSVAAKHETNGDSRCQSPVGADTAEKHKSNAKLTGGVITKVYGKASKPSNLATPMKTRPSNKKSSYTRTNATSSESSDSESENDKPYPALNNQANKKQGRGLMSGATLKGSSAPSAVNSSVQALKQKYRQQRLAKEKEAALTRSKKSTETSPRKDSRNVCKVNNDVRLILDKWNEYPVVNLSSFAVDAKEKINNSTPEKASANTATNSNSSVKKSTASSKSSVNVVSNVTTASGRKPVTRHAAILLQAAREKAEQEMVNKSTSKTVSKVEEEKKKTAKEVAEVVICDYEKHLPLLESEHSYVKRLPMFSGDASAASPTTPVPASKLKHYKHSSDFSSSDDEPLVKKKDAAGKQQQPQQKVSTSSSNNKNGIKDNKQNKKLLKASVGTYLTRSVRCLDVQQQQRSTPESKSVPSTPTPLVSSRPTRKTKEAASVYLQMLGQGLNSCDDDYELPPKPNSLLKCDYKKQLFITPNKQKQSLPARSRDNLNNNGSSVSNNNNNKLNQPLEISTSSYSSNSSSAVSSSSSSSSSTSTSTTSPSTSNSPPTPGNPKNNMKCYRTYRKWRMGKSPTVVQCLNTPLERIDVVKTRDFMRKLSDARFNMARDQTEKVWSKNVTHTKQGVIIHNMDAKCLSKNSLVKLQDRKGQPSKFLSTQERQSGKPMPKYVKSRLPDNSKVLSFMTMKTMNRKVKGRVGPTAKKSACGVAPPHTLNKSKFVKRMDDDDSSSSDSSSFTSVPQPPRPPPPSTAPKVVAYRRGPGRVPAMHALRHMPVPEIPDSTSTDSSDDDEDIPSKPEATTISVRQNVTSNSVAVQVNLLDDMSNFDDDCWEPGFMESGIEGLFSLERTATPVFPKGNAASSSSQRLSWESENASSGGKSLVCKSREHTPTKLKTELVMNSCRLSSSNSPKKINRCPTSSSSSPSPVIQKEFKRPSLDRASHQLESSSDDDSSGFHIPIGALSGVKDAPVFYPTEKEFQDPLLYIEKIRSQAEKFGICKIVPPASFKPECKINNEMRFTGHNQYIHKVFHRVGPNVQQMSVIRKHLEAQKIDYDNPPLIGGMEVDLPRLFHTVQQYGGLQEVIEKKKWQKVADSMKIAKSALDKVNKLYEAYCKYLLPYDTLSKQEKQEIENKVSMERRKGRFNEVDECVTKGRSMSLSSFSRIARNTMAMWAKNEAKPSEIEQEYWRIVNQRKYHLCVHAGNIDSSTFGYGFTTNKNSTFGKHPWNLKVLTNNPKSILRCMGPVMGVTIPTLHVGMLFTTGCWYRDPHCLPWIEYLHTGASKIWYSVPASQSCKFRDAMRKIVPDFCTNNPIWLPSDTAMVPPDLLVENGASLYRLVQNNGQFVVVFPRVFTSTICCGYNISESVYFAGSDWLEIAPIAFKEISDSCEPAVFSLQRLLMGIAKDGRTLPDVLKQVLPLLKEMRDNEIELRKRLSSLGLKQSRHVDNFEVKDLKNRQVKSQENQVEECDICRAICYISLVCNKQESSVYCLRHAVEHLQKKKKDIKFCEMLYTIDTADLDELIGEVSGHQRGAKRVKKSGTKKS